MTLWIKTEEKPPAWLLYILEEFRRVGGAGFTLSACSLHEGTGSDPVIYYTGEYVGGVCLPNRSTVKPDGETEFLDDHVFYWRGTGAGDSRFAAPCDIFWNAFIALSRLEEYQLFASGKRQGACSFNHPRGDKSTFDIPVVNGLFAMLEVLICKHFPSLSFAAGAPGGLELSHDVDYLAKTPQIILKKTVFNIINVFRNARRPSRLPGRVAQTVTFPFTRPSYWGFDEVERLEKELDRRSIFYVYAGAATAKNVKTCLVDPSYDVFFHKGLKEKLRRLREDGFEIGLHGSWKSALNGEVMRKEKARLETALGMEIRRVRQHWLHYREDVTPYIHEELFETDSTLGWNDLPGFRAGCASRYRPWDHRGGRPFSFFQVPQVVMDSQVFDYGTEDPEEAVERIRLLIRRGLAYKNACFSISWHTHSFNSDFPWGWAYRKLAREGGGDVE